MNINTTDKVQVGETTTSTSTSTTASQWQTYNHYKAEQGWECPRCGRINAPWVRQCDCSRGNWQITWTSDHVDIGDKPGWWKEVTCHDDNILNNPTIYQVGGSDYQVAPNTYVNVGGTQSNKVDKNSTTYAWNNIPHTYTDSTIVTDGINNYYNLKMPKEK